MNEGLEIALRYALQETQGEPDIARRMYLMMKMGMLYCDLVGIESPPNSSFSVRQKDGTPVDERLKRAVELTPLLIPLVTRLLKEEEALA